MIFDKKRIFFEFFLQKICICAGFFVPLHRIWELYTFFIIIIRNFAAPSPYVSTGTE